MPVLQLRVSQGLSLLQAHASNAARKDTEPSPAQTRDPRLGPAQGVEGKATGNQTIAWPYGSGLSQSSMATLWIRFGAPRPPGTGCRRSCPGPDKAPQTYITMTEPRVTTVVAGKPISFLIDTRATYSALSEFAGTLSTPQSLLWGLTD